MSQFITEALIQNGHLELKDIPLQDGLAVKVIIVPPSRFVKNVIPGNLEKRSIHPGKACFGNFPRKR